MGSTEPCQALVGKSPKDRVDMGGTHQQKTDLQDTDL